MTGTVETQQTNQIKKLKKVARETQPIEITPTNESTTAGAKLKTKGDNEQQ